MTPEFRKLSDKLAETQIELAEALASLRIIHTVMTLAKNTPGPVADVAIERVLEVCAKHDFGVRRPIEDQKLATGEKEEDNRKRPLSPKA